MSEQDPMVDVSPEEMISALFANLVVQQANMAFIFLGKVPHPETGEVVQDFESAQFFIDQLEMLAAKTKGNLDQRETHLLQQSLMSARMAFVEAMEGQDKKSSEQRPTTPETATKSAGTADERAFTPQAATTTDNEDDSRKKFSKKY